MTNPKRKRNANQLEKQIVVLSKGSESEPDTTKGKNPAAVALGRLGGKKGGQARAESMTPERRKEIAKKAAEKRWKKS